MTRTEAPRYGRLHALADDVGPKLLVTLVAAGVSALLIPSITSKWQDHKQQLELRTTIAGEMSRAFTSVIVSGRFVTGGLVYSGSTSKAQNTAATQNAWTSALRDWLVASETIGAELTGRYGISGMASDWRRYSAAVTGYMRIGSQVPSDVRATLLERERAYVKDPKLPWQALARTSGFKRDPRFRAAYEELGGWLLGRGDALVQEELKLDPRV